METDSGINELTPFFTGAEQNSLDFLEQDISIIFWSYDKNTKEFLLTEGMEELYEYSYDVIKKLELWETLYKQFDNNMENALSIAIIKQEPFNYEYKFIKMDGSIGWVRLQGRPVFSPQKELALMGTLLDITEKKQAQEMANYLAYYDSLTGIPNRNWFYETSHLELLELKKKKQKAAFLFIDLDQFKVVNDTLGHHAGDQILKQAATKFKEFVGEKGHIARYGGDEFVVLLKYDTLFEVEDFLNKIIQEIPEMLSSHIKLTPRIGISLFPKHGEEIESLVRFSDMAKNDLKSNDQKQSYIYYDDSMSTNRLRMNRLSNDLHTAIEENQLYVVYQPKIDLYNYKIEGMEALIRWKHPLYGNISPIEFIPLAENNGFIHTMGDWVIKTAINESLKLNYSITLNVNISTRQLLRETFVETVQMILHDTQFPMERLNLEITESVALYDVDKAVKTLNQLKNLGITLSLDDFGTGYSSLSYLTKLPVDYLKIDQSFIYDLENNDSNKTVVKFIIKVAHSLNMKVTAEGIETKKQADLLRKYSCDNGQGYYFSKPLPINEISNYLEQSRRHIKKSWFAAYIH
jgi:diguanylate cyclase (GGDEF)-like protein/PAS domain S-box-containing protein